MCQEVHLSDVRSALLDYCDQGNRDDEHIPVDDLLARFDAPAEPAYGHALDHGRRANELSEAGDHDGAAIHKALIENIARTAAAQRLCA